MKKSRPPDRSPAPRPGDSPQSPTSRSPKASIIDHIGIAVNLSEEAERRWAAILDEPPAGEETVPAEGIRATLFGQGPGRIELLSPLTPDSPIGRFLERRGPGIHHVCIRVAQIEGALERAEAAGAEVIRPRIRTGAGGGRIAFLHPRSMGGVLLEMKEDPELA